MNASVMRFRLLAVAAVLFLLPLGRSHADTIIPFGSDWEWLHPVDGIDPALDDPDFNFTWQIPAAYNGPDFNAPSPAELGYGDLETETTDPPHPVQVTDIGTPPSGSRFSAYFRKDFTVPAGGYTDIAINMVRDDGAIIYLDGFEIAREHMPADDDSYMLLALSPAIGGTDEFLPVPITLSAVGLELDPGEHTIAVSMHQQAVTSSDISFDLELNGTPGIVPEPSSFVMAGCGLAALACLVRRKTA